MITTNIEIQGVIQNILKKLIAEYATQRVILFGSYAYGEPHVDSDVDLLIINETSGRFIDRWVVVRRILSDPERRILLEALVLTPGEVSERLAVGDQFIAEIIEKGEALYSA